MKDRRNRIGGSDVPIIIGESKFKTPFELFKEKVGLEDNEFGGNLYTELGNILEPKIQKLFSVTDEQKNVSKEIGFLDFSGQIDGMRNDKLVEIKVSSYSLEEAIKQYHSQIQSYLWASGINECEFIVCSRDGEIKELFNQVREAFNLPHMHDFSNCDNNLVEKIKEALKVKFDDFEITQENCETKIISFNKEKFNDITLPRVNKFVDVIKLYYEKMFEIEDLENFFNTHFYGSIIPAEMNDLALKIENLEEKLVESKEIQAKIDNFKKELKKAMQGENIKKITLESGSQFTLVADGEDKEVENVVVDEKKFIEENQALVEKYQEARKRYETVEKKIKTGRKGYVKITLKGK